MTGPQRRPATRGAFPEPGPVMRRPGGGSPVLAVSRSGAQWKADKSGVPLAEQGSCFSRCYARPSELASAGRVKSRTLAGGPGSFPPPRRSRIARADALRRLHGWRCQLSAPGVETADSNRAVAELREAGREAFGARERAGAERQRSVPTWGLRAQRADVDVAREKWGRGAAEARRAGRSVPPSPLQGKRGY